MKWLSRLCVSIVLLACAGAATAGDSPLYTDFSGLCAAHDGASASTLAAADAAGWFKLNSSMVPMPSTGAFKLTSYQVRLRNEGGETMLLLVGDGTTLAAGAAINVGLCMVLSKPADPVGIAEAKAWLGMEPMLSSAQGALYVFGRSVQRPTPLSSATLPQAIKAGQARLVVIPPTQSDTSVLIYAVPKTAV